MNQLQTKGIILARTDYGEADRIITLLTPERGKLRLMAKGVRRIKSKLAGGIELFSVSDITYIQGRGDIGTLVSSRLDVHYGSIVKDIDRTMLGYELIKQLNKATEDSPEAEYFDLLHQAFEALDDKTIALELIRVWFDARLLTIAGHSPNLETDTDGTKLAAASRYDFNIDAMTFQLHPEGGFGAAEIKLLRLLLAGYPPKTLAKVGGADKLMSRVGPLVQSLQRQYSR